MITLNRKDLSNALANVSPCVPSKTPKEILKSIHLHYNGNDLCITATNSEIWATSTIPAQGDGEVSFVVSHEKLQQIASSSTSESISIEPGEVLKITCGNNKFSISTSLEDGFPYYTKNDSDFNTRFEIAADVIKEGFESTKTAVDNDSTRYALAGVNLETSGNTVTFVSTDSRRMHLFNYEFADGQMPKTQNVIPIPAVKAISKICGSGNAVVSISSSGIEVSCNNCKVYSPFNSGRFPDWRRFAKIDTKFNASVSCEDLNAAINSVLITTSVESKATRVSFSDSEIVFTSEMDTANSNVRLNAVCDFDGEFTFNPDYINGYISKCDTDKPVSIGMSDDMHMMTLSNGDSYRAYIVGMVKD